MAALLPFIQDLLPMIMPSQVYIKRGRDLVPESWPGTMLPGPPPKAAATPPAVDGADPASDPLAPIELVDAEDDAAMAPPASPTTSPGGAVLRRDAIVHKTDRMCASVLFAAPHSKSAVQHNSEHDTIIFAASGRGFLATSPPDTDEGEAPPQQHVLDPGDFAFIPAWTEHQLVNDTDDNVVWVVIQGGSAPIVVPLTGWGGAEA